MATEDFARAQGDSPPAQKRVPYQAERERLVRVLDAGKRDVVLSLNMMLTPEFQKVSAPHLAPALVIGIGSAEKLIAFRRAIRQAAKENPQIVDRLKVGYRANGQFQTGSYEEFDLGGDEQRILAFYGQLGGGDVISAPRLVYFKRTHYEGADKQGASRRSSLKGYIGSGHDAGDGDGPYQLLRFHGKTRQRMFETIRDNEQGVWIVGMPRATDFLEWDICGDCQFTEAAPGARPVPDPREQAELGF